ncbi:cation-transporting P-type ATPase [Nonomuraea basaltis]|uniref:cation-transporting P-type ATPase n=1 Tax=Nonomuraea basaltis TaxID=2495887 RepID=UPI001F0F4D74|nr:cation-transporting P-type ATPase [Nonomuraea basaltis]
MPSEGSVHVLPREGLSSAEATRRLAADGPNRLPSGERSPVALLLFRELVHFFALMLWAATGLALLADAPTGRRHRRSSALQRSLRLRPGIPCRPGE